MLYIQIPWICSSIFTLYICLLLLPRRIKTIDGSITVWSATYSVFSTIVLTLGGPFGLVLVIMGLVDQEWEHVIK
jgi:hypothetical protein